jgi:hypothetical protein
VTVINRYDDRDAALGIHNETLALQSERVLARLAGPQSLSGKHRLRDQLVRLGLLSR